MATPSTEADPESSIEFRQGLLELYGTFRRSVALTVSVLGGVLIIIGLLIEIVHPTMGGIFALWGVVALITGPIAYFILWLNKNYR